MTLEQPESMEELVYWTNRNVGEGHVKAWVFREDCPECKKEKMGKPVDEKTGKVKIRAKEYTCPACQHTVEKETYEDTLTANVEYTCPSCKKEGEAQIPFKRKTVKLETGKSAKALQVICEHCNAKINITKKVK